MTGVVEKFKAAMQGAINKSGMAHVGGDKR
jgi:hypothetical protein